MDIGKNTLGFQELVTICQIQKLDTFVLTFFIVFRTIAFIGDCIIMTRSLKPAGSFFRATTEIYSRKYSKSILPLFH